MGATCGNGLGEPPEVFAAVSAFVMVTACFETAGGTNVGRGEPVCGVGEPPGGLARS